jgi:hypothetical protein
MNTLKMIFGKIPPKSLKEVPKIIYGFANNKIKIRMSRKLQFLTLVQINDPFFELLGYIRDQNTLGK